MTKSYMILEEKLNTQFDNLVSTNANSSRPVRRDSQRRKDGFERGMHELYEKYTPLNTSWDKIYQDCANTKF